MYKIARVRLLPELAQLIFLENVAYNYTKQLIQISRHYEEKVEANYYVAQIKNVPFNSKYALINAARKNGNRIIASDNVVQYCQWSSRNCYLTLYDKTISLQKYSQFSYTCIHFKANRYQLELLEKGRVCSVKIFCLDNDWYADIFLQFIET